MSPDRENTSAAAWA